jgi:hypothetical protein
VRALHRPDLTSHRAPHDGAVVLAHRHAHHDDEACRSTREHPPSAANTVRAAQDPLLLTNQERFKGQTEQLNVNSKDMPSVEAAVTAKLQQDPSVDHIIALDASIALTAVQSKKTAGSNAVIDTFDTNAELVSAIKNGDVGWAIDQQPFLQGYLAIDSLWLFINNRNLIGGGTPVLTGPAFIDKSNIDAIAEYAANGTR